MSAEALNHATVEPCAHYRPGVVSIREATANDADSISALYQLLTPGKAVNVMPERLAAIADHHDNFLLVAEIEGVVCGTVFVCFCMDAMYGEQPFTLVENVVIAPAWRQQGIGTQLFSRVETMSIERASSKIMLLSSVEREPAHAFFRQIGFSSDKKRGFVKYRSQFSS